VSRKYFSRRKKKVFVCNTTQVQRKKLATFIP